MSDDARILMAQHAKTAQLMGVDFLPLGDCSMVVDSGSEIASANEQPDVPTVSAGIVEEPVDSRPSFAPRAQVGHEAKVQEVPTDVEPIGFQDLRGVYEQVDGQSGKLEALKAKYELEAPHQYFNTQFTNIVFGEGDANADLMFIGEAPGADEDASGRPFVGRAGQLLENMIKAMGLSRETVYIANVLKTQPTGNATPTGGEAALCSPYLMEQIRIVSPKVIVTLGLPASHLLLQITSPMRSMRGHWHSLPTQVIADGIPGVEVMPTYHPAYLLRSYTEENRRKVWADLTQVMQKLGLSS